MPIKPENRHRYPPKKEWLQIRQQILHRADNKCEFCGVPNYTVRLHARIVLAVADIPHPHHPEFEYIKTYLSPSSWSKLECCLLQFKTTD